MKAAAHHVISGQYLKTILQPAASEQDPEVKYHDSTRNRDGRNELQERFNIWLRHQRLCKQTNARMLYKSRNYTQLEIPRGNAEDTYVHDRLIPDQGH